MMPSQRLRLLLWLPLLASRSDALPVPVLPWSDYGSDTLASVPAGNCARLCARLPECRAVACSSEAGGRCLLLAALCDSGWQKFDSACFSLQAGKLEWSASKTHCRELREDSELASIHSEAENNFVKTLLGGQSAWIGLEHTPRQDGQYAFSWLDGTPLDFTFWREEVGKQPNEPTTLLICVMASSHTGLWIDYRVQEGMTKYGQLCKYSL